MHRGPGSGTGSGKLACGGIGQGMDTLKKQAGREGRREGERERQRETERD